MGGREDTDAYREKRAVSAFNHAAQVANDMLQLNPTMLTWVYHVMCFIVPRQILELGDPSRRSCDACESFGAMFKKIVKHLTCRRNISSNGSTHTRRAKQWRQTFTKSYLEQAFERVAVRETLIHGEANAPYVQREDNCLLTHGTANQKDSRGPKDAIISLADLVMAPTVPTHLQESAHMA